MECFFLRVVCSYYFFKDSTEMVIANRVGDLKRVRMVGTPALGKDSKSTEDFQNVMVQETGYQRLSCSYCVSYLN